METYTGDLVIAVETDREKKLVISKKKYVAIVVIQYAYYICIN